MNNKQIQLGFLILGVIGMFLTLVFKLWDNQVGGLILVAFSLIYVLFILVAILFFKVYGRKSNKVRRNYKTRNGKV